MDKRTLKWSTVFGIAMLYSSVVCVTAAAGEIEYPLLNTTQDTLTPKAGRKIIQFSILASTSTQSEDVHSDTMRSRARKRTEQPDYADVQYGPYERNKLDIWLAENESPTPLVVYFHGGGFFTGDKHTIRQSLNKQNLLSSLLAAGISVAAVNYRLSTTAPYPAQMHDGARALQFLRYNAARYNIDPARIGVSGTSAGGGISLWLAFHEDLSDPVSKDPINRLSTRVSAAVVYNTQTTYDPRKIMKLFNTKHVEWPLIKFFGMYTANDVNDPKYHPLFIDASSINHLTTDDVPVLLYYSQAEIPLEANTRGHKHIHHPRFGQLLKEKMDQLVIVCVLKLREDYRNSSSNVIKDSVNFFIDAFNKNNHAFPDKPSIQLPSVH